MRHADTLFELSSRRRASRFHLGSPRLRWSARRRGRRRGAEPPLPSERDRGRAESRDAQRPRVRGGVQLHLHARALHEERMPPRARQAADAESLSLGRREAGWVGLACAPSWARRARARPAPGTWAYPPIQRVNGGGRRAPRLKSLQPAACLGRPAGAPAGQRPGGGRIFCAEYRQVGLTEPIDIEEDFGLPGGPSAR